MKIKKIKINSFGKLQDKEIKLDQPINIIYGKNESGKSTLLKFIFNSFYGISKNKKGKEYSDYDKYIPWVGEDFSGKLQYELDNKKTYEIFRDFKKKNPKIFNEKMEDISKEFNIDKAKGNEFFYEQTKVDEELFLSTLIVNQQEVKLEKSEQNILIQKIANLVGTGEDNVSFKKAIDRINRRQLDEVGTQRSREKPINLVTRAIEDLEREQRELVSYQNMQYEIQENKNELLEEIVALEKELNFLKEIKLIHEKEKIEKEKIQVKEKIRDENVEKINIAKNKINEIRNNNNFENEIYHNSDLNKTRNNTIKKESNKNQLINKLIISFILLIIISILQFIFIPNQLFNYIFLLTVPMLFIFSIYLINKENKKIKEQEKNKENKLEEINNQINYLNNEIKLIESNNIELNNEIKIVINEFDIKINSEKENIKNKYLKEIDNQTINYFSHTSDLENLNIEIQNVTNEINQKKLKEHTLDLDKKNIEPKLDNLSRIEEDLVNNKDKKVNLEKLDKSIVLAKEILSSSYEQMKSTVTPRFAENLSENISNITGGKYSNVRVHDEQGLLVETEQGDYIEGARLSIGTIDQLYLSLRLSMVKELSQEKMPILLDEAFAYFDTERLENILKYLIEKYDDRQIIIFTCTNREREILEKENICFNLIEL